MHPQYTPEFHAHFDARLTICPQTGCWLWTLSLGNTGYGKTSYLTKDWHAHRLAYALAVGPIPAGQCVRHMCEGQYLPGDISYRRCCNPAHLAVGMHKQNMEDMVRAGRAATGNRHGLRAHPENAARGLRNGHYTVPERTPRGESHDSRRHPERRPRGEAHSSAKLTAAQVDACRTRYDAGVASIRQLATELGVSWNLVYRVVKRRTWNEPRSARDSDR